MVFKFKVFNFSYDLNRLYIYKFEGRLAIPFLTKLIVFFIFPRREPCS